MSKYRIKIVTYKNGRKGYIAEIKGGLWGWNSIHQNGEICVGIELEDSTREDALRRIDNHSKGNKEVQTIEFEYINK